MKSVIKTSGFTAANQRSRCFNNGRDARSEDRATAFNINIVDDILLRRRFSGRRLADLVRQSSTNLTSPCPLFQVSFCGRYQPEIMVDAVDASSRKFMLSDSARWRHIPCYGNR